MAIAFRIGHLLDKYIYNILLESILKDINSHGSSDLIWDIYKENGHILSYTNVISEDGEILLRIDFAWPEIMRSPNAHYFCYFKKYNTTGIWKYCNESF